MAQRAARHLANLHPGRIALGYVAISLVWIYGSGYAIQLPIFAGIESTLELLKGTGFVLVTAFGLYVLLARRSRAIEDTQQALIEIDDQRTRMVAAVEQSAEGIVITDLTPDILYVNPAFVAISGYAETELLGKNPNIVKSGQHDVAFWQSMWATLLRGESWHGRFINSRKDGVIYEADTVITPVRDNAGAIVAYAGVQHDTTRERALERHLAEAGRMEAIGQLAGGIAHDFNNLLMAIMGHAQLLKAGADLDAEASEDVTQIVRASESAASLVSQLLAFGRRQVLQPELLDLAMLVDDLRPMLAGLLGPTIRLEVDTAGAAGAVFADAGQLEQVIVNLAVNARDAMPAGGAFNMQLSNVEVDGSDGAPVDLRPGRYARLTATDTGSGMDAATRTRVFEPFFTTKAPGRGSGLGLATAYGIVDQTGGYLMVESELGLGSTFTVYLPHHDATGSLPRTEERQPVPRGSETILVVEDEAPVLAVIERTLRQLGYDVVVATGSAAALELAETTTPSLLLTDVRLPGLDGPALAARIAERRPGLPVLFVSGYASDTMIEGGLINEDAAFLAKPFTADELGRRVRQLLDK
jgi:two-component system, cell cycle sensor histidine kinase and response regulator CckA